MILQSGCNLGRIVFLAFLMLLVSSPSIGQRTTTTPTDSIDLGMGGANAIEGSIMSPSGQRLNRRIKIRLLTPTRGDTTSMTDEQGKFVFRGLPSGDYMVVIDGDKDFETVTQLVSIIQLRGSAGQVYSLQVRLKFKANAEAKPEVINAQFADVPKPALEFYNKAVELAKEKDYQGAVEQLKLAVAEYTNFMLAYNEMGVHYLHLNDTEKADEAFQSALKIDAEAFIPLMNRGALLVRLNKFSEAETVLKKAVKVNEKSAAAYYYLGQAIGNQNRFDEAEKEFLSAVKFGGDEMKEAHRYLAVIYSSRGDHKRTVEHLEAYLKLAPLAADAEQIRALVQKLKGAKP